MTRTGLLAVLAVALAAAGGCGGGGDRTGPGNPAGSARLNGGGSSFINPLMTKWASVYDKERGVKVDYSSVGSGNGIQQMIAKTNDFGCTDAPMNEENLEKAKTTGGEVLHIPLVMGAIVPAYNLPEIAEPIKFTGAVLADIYLGKIKRWNDPALKQSNPQLNLPDKDIAVIYRSDGSGSTYIWTDFLCKVSPDWDSRVKKGTTVSWPVGVGARGTEGVAGQLGRTDGAIGYLEHGQAVQRKLRYGSVQNAAGSFIQADLPNVTAAASEALTQIPDDLRYSLTNAPGKESYPICGTVWAVLYVKQPAGKGSSLVDFLRWATHDGQQYAPPLHYAPLPKGLVERVEKKLEQVQATSP